MYALNCNQAINDTIVSQTDDDYHILCKIIAINSKKKEEATLVQLKNQFLMVNWERDYVKKEIFQYIVF